MPLTKMTCPHCEEEIQVPVASVTRLRVCPACGETVLLNLSGGVQKRAALLVQSEAILEPVAVALPYLPKPLTEEEINLQRRDPESRRLLLKLVVGMVSVILLVGLLVLLEGDEGSELAVVEPEVASVGAGLTLLRRLSSPLAVAMSGSGPSLFALFADLDQALAAQAELAGELETAGFHSWACALRPAGVMLDG